MKKIIVITLSLLLFCFGIFPHVGVYGKDNYAEAVVNVYYSAYNASYNANFSLT